MMTETTRAYKRLFATEDGQTVLADLKRRFGWAEDGIEKASCAFGVSHADACLREGCKIPLRLIQSMIAAKDEPNKKQEAQHGLQD